MEIAKSFLDKVNNELKDELVSQLDQKLRRVVNDSFLAPEEALLVLMELIFTLFAETEGHYAEMKFSDGNGVHHKFTLEIKVPAAL
ncbi:hypothetical protein ACQ86O_27805 (plasmid) [Serratia sp. L9]|uniref:hypothetical protein n=1 Tax=Serratia sp. L9 TaxID=3423946 RepID=UPI003D67CD11